MIEQFQRGMQFVRVIRAIASAGPGGDAVAFARINYGDHIALLVKGLVDAGSTTEGNWSASLSTPEQAEFWAVVVLQTIIGKLLGLRVVPLNVRTVSATSGSTAYWVSAGNPKPLSKMAFLGSSLTPLQLACLIAFTQELLRHGSPEAEQRFRDDMIRALVEELDRTFIDPSNAGVSGERPSSVTNGVAAIPSAGNPGTDIATLISAFLGDLTLAAFVTDPTTAAQIALARDAGGAYLFPDCSPRGGSILGLPLITSRSSPRDSNGGQVALLDPTGIAYGSEGIKVALSRQTTLSMQDNPTSPIEQVSLFQTNAVALLCEINANWEIQRPGSVSLVTGTNYATEVDA